jgi:ABC-2 type transport system ATP-binding protein
MLEINNLSFNFGKAKIFKDFNLEIAEKEVTLITGINGVGKSTLLRLIAGVLKPASGKILFNEKMGNDPRRYIGFISDAPSLYESMTVAQAIDFHRSVYKIDRFDDSLLKRTKVTYHQKVKELSMGQRVIFHLSLLLSGDPKLLLIDEVIHSIDVYLRGIFLKELITILSEKDVTVIFVNLNFSDIENIVDRVILLKDGEVAVDEKIDVLKSKVRKITATNLPEEIPVLFKIEYTDHTEYFIYPFMEEYRERVKGEVLDLDLTGIINAFIGKEYV